MPRAPRVLTMIMAGGRGQRLFPLTRERSKPSVPFGGRYRIIDFVISNLVNSGFFSMYVLVQYRSQSLIEHLRTAWRTTGILVDAFIAVVPPQQRAGEAWYRGTADAVLQNLHLVDDFAPDTVAVFGADHIYRMDISQMLAVHLESGADATVAARPVRLEQASAFGVLGVDRQHRVVAWEEKPTAPTAMPDDPSRALVSMGNYVFRRSALVEALLDDARRSTDHDFGRSIIPEMVASGRVFAYDFQQNEVPGVKPYEEPAYWRDVGNIENYWDAHMDILGESPRFDLDNRAWPIQAGAHPGPPARFIGGDVENSMIAEGCLIKRATIRNSILGRNVWVNEGARIEDSIVMDYTSVGKGAHIRRAIIDRYNIIAADHEVGLDAERDRLRFHVDPSGLVVVPRGGRREYLRGLEEL